MKKTFRFVIAITLSLLINYSKAFGGETDSLMKLLSTGLTDTARINVLNALSKTLCNGGHYNCRESRLQTGPGTGLQKQWHGLLPKSQLERNSIELAGSGRNI